MGTHLFVLLGNCPSPESDILFDTVDSRSFLFSFHPLQSPTATLTLPFPAQESLDKSKEIGLDLFFIQTRCHRPTAVIVYHILTPFPRVMAAKSSWNLSTRSTIRRPDFRMFLTRSRFICSLLFSPWLRAWLPSSHLDILPSRPKTNVASLHCPSSW